MHLDEEQVQRLLDGELPPVESTRVRAHVAECVDCLARVNLGRREDEESRELLRALDHPLPPLPAHTVVVRARSRRWGWMYRAAAVLFVLGVGGVAWAAPGSPLRALLREVVAAMSAAPSQPAPTPAPADTPVFAGIAVAPGASLLIHFASAQGDGAFEVALTDGAEVVVRGPVGAATFTSGDDGIVIDNSGSDATFEIEIPRGAARVEIRVDGTRVLLKSGAAITAATAVRNGASYVVSLRKAPTPTR